VADVIRAHGAQFIERNRQRLRRQHLKALSAIERCRTVELGGHVDECSRCGHRAISYNSCRNRHCPKCQGNSRTRWLAARRSELLPVRYVHVVFTLPHELAPLALANQKVIYDLLFRTSAEAMMELAGDPRLLGAEIGFFSVLHTWNQKLEHHPHVHCVVPEGGLSPDHTGWIGPRYPYFLPVKALWKLFAGKFSDALKAALAAGELRFPGRLAPFAKPKLFARLLRTAWRHDWVVYAKRPFGGPEHVLSYLGNYTHRVAISNRRMLGLVDGQVRFRWRDRAHNNRKRVMTLPAEEFLRRFLLHVLPRGFVRIRHFGFLTNRHKQQMLALCRTLLPPAATASTVQPAAAPADVHFWKCPCCGGAMAVIERLSFAQIRLRAPPDRQAAA
jgi:hypothetical protein